MKKIYLLCIAIFLVSAFVRPAIAQAKPVIVALSKAHSTLAIIDPATMKVTAKVPTRADPHEVVISADSKTAFVTSVETDSVLRIDIEKMEVTHRVEIGKGPDGTAVFGQ